MPCTALVWRPLYRCQFSDVPDMAGFKLAGSLDLLNETSCLWVEEGVWWSRAHRPTWGRKSLDVVVCGECVAVRGPIDTVGLPVWHCERRHCVWLCQIL